MFLAWWYLRKQTTPGPGPGEVNANGPIDNGPEIREHLIGPRDDNPDGLPVPEPGAGFGFGRRDYTGSSRTSRYSNPFHGPGRDLNPSHYAAVPNQYPFHNDGRGLEDLPPPPLANSPPSYLPDGASTFTSDMPHPSFAHTSSPHTAFMSDGMSTTGRETRGSYGLPFPQSLAYAPIT